MNRSLFMKLVGAVALALAVATPALAAPWKFGVMSDTQWRQPNTTVYPYTVAVGIIDQLNAEFVRHGVEFVVQTGDLTDNGSSAAMQMRADAAKALYDAGIGFYPLRGNHESSQAAALQFQGLYPQTQGAGPNVAGATAFSSPFATLKGLSYSFDVHGARFVLLDQFTRTDGTSYLGSSNDNVLDQLPWITATLDAKAADQHAFVFAHKGLITENHVDTLFGANPAANPDAQDAFIGELQKAGVRYLFGGHDHMHNRALVASPDAEASVQDITTASNSYKFYIPQTGANVNDVRYDVPAFGFARETELAQELFTVGYYIVTVDGPRVTVDYWASPNGCSGDCDLTETPALAFTRRETFGYSLNGKEFLVPQAASYTAVDDSFQGTAAKILDGTNGSATSDWAGRPLAHAVDTGWTPRACGTASAALTLWGMSSMVPGLAANETDAYVLSMSYDRSLGHWRYGTGRFGIQARDDQGRWVPATDLTGGETRSVVGPWAPGYGLGTYGVDPETGTAWAVVDYQGEFRVANFDDAVTDAVCALEGKR